MSGRLLLLGFPDRQGCICASYRKPDAYGNSIKEYDVVCSPHKPIGISLPEVMVTLALSKCNCVTHVYGAQASNWKRTETFRGICPLHMDVRVPIEPTVMK